MEHRAHARKLANESMVLLRMTVFFRSSPGSGRSLSSGLLPIRRGRSLETMPASPTSMSPSSSSSRPNATITFLPGTQFLRTDGSPVPDALLTTPDGPARTQSRLHRGYATGAAGLSTLSQLVSRTEANVKLNESDSRRKECLWRAWLGSLRESGDFDLGIRCAGFVGLRSTASK